MMLKRQAGRHGQRAAALAGFAFLVALVSAAALLSVAGARTTQAQTQQTIFTGTVHDSVGAPPPAPNSLRLVVGLPTQSGPPQPYCAVGSSDGQGNFRLILEPLNLACSTPGTVLSLEVNDVAATPTTTVPGSPGVYTVNFTVPVPLGGQPLPTAAPAPLNPPSQPLTTLHTTALPVGCTQVIVSLGFGAGPAQVAAGIANPGALVGIWRFDNPTQRFLGYFGNPLAPSDLTALAPVDAVFVCVSVPTSITAP